MTSSQIPSRIAMPCPFGGFGSDNITPIGTLSGDNVNFPDGFPSAYGAPTDTNGKFVTRKEMNAIGNLASRDLFYHKCGGLNTFDADFCASIGGYPKGAVLQILDGYSIRKVMSLKDNNKVCYTGQTLTSKQIAAGLTNGSIDMDNWIYLDEKSYPGVFRTIDVNTVGISFLTTFTAPKSGMLVIDFENYNIDHNENSIDFNEKQEGGVIFPSLWPSLEYMNGAAVLITEYSGNIIMPTLTGVTERNPGQANWGTWKLAYGQISAGGGNIGTPATPTPAVFNSTVTANKRYAIAVASGHYNTFVKLTYKKMPDSNFDVSYTVNFVKDTFTATMKLSILP